MNKNVQSNEQKCSIERTKMFNRTNKNVQSNEQKCSISGKYTVFFGNEGRKGRGLRRKKEKAEGFALGGFVCMNRVQSAGRIL